MIYSKQNNFRKDFGESSDEHFEKISIAKNKNKNGHPDPKFLDFQTRIV